MHKFKSSASLRFHCELVMLKNHVRPPLLEILQQREMFRTFDWEDAMHAEKAKRANVGEEVEERGGFQY